MDDITLIGNYGFEKASDDLWTIFRSQSATTDAQGNELPEPRVEASNAAFRQLEGGLWVFTKEDGGKPFINFLTDDVRDVIAFAQTIIASTIYELSGSPLDEGFEFDGIHYASPFMFGPYWDFNTEKIGDAVWATHPAGEFRNAYLEWRDDFAARVLNGEATAPGEFHDLKAVAARKPRV